MLDLRVPTGLFFTLVGVILLLMSFVDPNAHAALTETNVNLYCGLSMVVFGAFLLLLAWRASRTAS
jgi:predicted phage tail protein